MKRLLTLALLVSIGLNLGLGLRLLRNRDGWSGKPADRWQAGDRPNWERPAPGDSTAWRQFMGRRMENLAERLDLRPDQVEYFQRGQQALIPRMRERRRALFETRTHLRELMMARDIDHPAVRRAMAELARRQSEADSLAAETVLGELGVLDPEQRVRYLDFLPDGGGRHGRRGRLGHHTPRD